MEVLRPATVWVSGRCYRVINPDSATTTTNYTEPDAYGFDDNMYQDELDCTNETDFTVEETSNGRFQTAFHIANSYIPYLIGSKGATKNRIERETYTTLKFPSKGQEGDVVVTGRDIKTVRQGRLKLEMLVEQARKKQPATHFVSMPINSPSIQERFLQFKKEVLEKCGDSRGVEESIFQDAAKLHLTLCVMVLADDRERNQAVETLNHCSDGVVKLLAGERLQVEMKGIEYMNDDPGEVNVLYGRVNATSWTHSLQTIADSTVAEFIKAGLATRQQERVKLHVTLMNTRYRYKDSESEDLKNQPRESFCAKKILKEFGEYEFGTLEVEAIHLSIRHTGSDTKYYSASAKIPLTPQGNASTQQ